MRFNPIIGALVFVVALTSCGDNGDGGDTVLTGFSGVLIFGIIVWIIWRYTRRKT